MSGNGIIHFREKGLFNAGAFFIHGVGPAISEINDTFVYLLHIKAIANAAIDFGQFFPIIY